MASGFAATSVISGVAYPVSSVAGSAPSGLDALVGETSFTIDMSGTPYEVHGAGSRLDDQVRFHEKDAVLGKDVRVWHVASSGDGLTATHVAAF